MNCENEARLFHQRVGSLVEGMSGEMFMGTTDFVFHLFLEFDKRDMELDRSLSRAWIYIRTEDKPPEAV